METLSIDRYSCPKCGASDRERLYMLYISKLTFSSNDSILHLAPEKALSDALKKIAKLEGVQYITADASMPEVDNFVDITDMDCYPENKFSFFICSHVLEHVVDDHKAVSELFRVTKPGGSGILMVPIVLTLKSTFEDYSKSTEEERWKYFGQYDHVRLYSRSDFVRLLRNAGFLVNRLDQKHLGFRSFRKAGLTSTSALYVVRKSSALK